MKRINSTPMQGISKVPGAPIDLEVEAILVPEGRRKASSADIAMIAKSMSEIGLRIPITVIYQPASADNEEKCAVPILVAGAHRLEAARSLGWKTIPCLVMDSDGGDAELWEIAENLHRSDLTKGQRDKYLRQYAELLMARENQCGQAVSFESKRADGKGHRPKGIASQIASETGFSTKTVSRALKPSKSEAAEQKDDRLTSSSENGRSRLTKAWSKASAEDRRWFLEWVSQELTQNDLMGLGSLKEAVDLIAALHQSQGGMQ